MLIRMFVGMMVISLAMPLIMIDSPDDYRIGLNQIYGALFMSANMPDKITWSYFRPCYLIRHVLVKRIVHTWHPISSWRK
jgi:hypothetical protein